ncbi:DUF1311 domain-containing protein [Thioclava sp. BHET1]|nr:DUF1311 domain-containing protein [Thioclava sp. BHET1]
MKPLSLLAVFALATPILATSALADPTVDPATVQACFKNAKTVLPACIGDAANACEDQPGGSTTPGIAACLSGETQLWDDLLNEQYKAARARLVMQGGKTLSDELLKTQRAWIAFRDADCGLEYSIWEGGTIRSVMAASCQLSRTAQRALELRQLGSLE